MPLLRARLRCNRDDDDDGGGTGGFGCLYGVCCGAVLWRCRAVIGEKGGEEEGGRGALAPSSSFLHFLLEFPV